MGHIPKAHDAGSHDQPMTPAIQRVVDEFDKRARDAAAMPAGCPTPSECRGSVCHGECLAATFDAWWDSTGTKSTPETYAGWENSCRRAWNAGQAALAAAPHDGWAPVVPRACIKPTHEAADAFWRYWRENGETHKHGYYESTWGAINAALAHGYTPPAPAPQPIANHAPGYCPHCKEYTIEEPLPAQQPSEEVVSALRDCLSQIDMAACYASEEGIKSTADALLMIGMHARRALALLATSTEIVAKAAAPQGEPVAWRDPTNTDPGQGCTYDKAKRNNWPHLYAQPLYAAQPSAWISCDERMPDPGQEVLVWLATPPCKGCGNVVMDCWDEEHEALVSFSTMTAPVGMGWDSGLDWSEITHWMPIPPAPVAKDGE